LGYLQLFPMLKPTELINTAIDPLG
jgi:hypothetical protein